MTQKRREPASYHHGDLRSSLIVATLEIVAKVGVRGFSVAEAARRTGVSSGAPFRHFAGRDALLAATGVVAFDELRHAYSAAAKSSTEPAQQLAAMTVAYVSFSIDNPGGFELVSGAGFDARSHPEFQEARRGLVDVLLPVGEELTSDHQAALDLVGTQYALANGYAALAARGNLEPAKGTPDMLARARRGTLALIAGWDRS